MDVLLSPAEEGDLRTIERTVGRRIPRRQVDGFDYQKRAAEKLEIPVAERIAAIRARKSDERKRAAEKTARRTSAPAGRAPHGRPPAAPAQPARRTAPQRPARRPERPARPAHLQHSLHESRPAHRPAPATADSVPWWLRRDA